MRQMIISDYPSECIRKANARLETGQWRVVPGTAGFGSVEITVECATKDRPARTTHEKYMTVTLEMVETTIVKIPGQEE